MINPYSYIHQTFRQVLVVIFVLFLAPDFAHAAYTPFNTSATGNIGISSANPGQALDVQGTIRGLYFSGNGSGLTNLLTTSSQWTTTNTTDVYLASGGNVGIGTTITNAGAALSVMNGNVGIGTWAPAYSLGINGNLGIGTLVPGGSLVVTSTGNIGLGLTNPTYRLELYSSSQTAGQAIAIETSGGTYGQQLYGNDIYYDDTANGNYIWRNNDGTERMRLTSAGNLGVGTNSPGSVLSVLGGASLGSYATSAAPAGGLIASGNIGIGSLTPGQALDVNGTVRATNFVGNGSGLTNLSTTSSQWTTTNTTDIYLASRGNVGIGTTITNGGALSVMNGNVGIGTWLPGNALTVNGGITSGIPGTGTFQVTSGGVISTLAGVGVTLSNSQFLGATSSSFTIENQNATSGNSTLVQGGAGAASYLTLNSNGASGTTDYISFGVNNGVTQAMRIQDNSGIANVGIGSTNPGQTLDVNGTVRMTAFQLGTSTTSGYVLTANSSGVGTWQAAAGGANYWLNDAGNVGINTTYNIGIGTISQNNSLNILGNIGVGKSAGDSYLTTAAPSGGMIVEGNVGIGSVAPGQALDVNGTVRALGEILTSNVPSSTTNELYNNSGALYFNGSTVGANYWTNDSGNVGINTTYSIGIGTISQNNSLNILGNVGIGKTSGSNYLINAAPTGGIIAEGNVGFGTYVPTGALEIENGNVGIGTWTTSGGQLIISTRNGNVGIGSITPGQVLDVQGTVRSTGGVTNGEYASTEFDNGSQSGSYTINWSKGNCQYITLTGSTTFTFSNPISGVRLILEVAGAYTPTFPGTVRWSGGTTPTATATGGAKDIYIFYYSAKEGLYDGAQAANYLTS